MPWTREQHLDALSNTDLGHFIIETVEENSMIGFALMAGLVSVHPSIELRRIVITKKGQGYGKKLSSFSKN